MRYALVLLLLPTIFQCSSALVIRSPVGQPKVVRLGPNNHTHSVSAKLKLAKPGYIVQNSDYRRYTSSPEREFGKSSHNLELICRLKIYIDTASTNRTIEVQEFKKENRIVFLIPFFIIYWHYRYPRHPMPLTEVDEFLDELGDEAIIYRLELKEFMMKLDGKESCLEISSWNQTNIEHLKTAETILNLYGLNDGHEHQETPDFSSPSIRRGIERYSESSEVRHWLENFRRQSC